MTLTLAPAQRKNLVILFFTIMVVNIGFGIILPILPYYAQNMGASASVLGLLSASYAALQFVFAPVWGRYSDRIGRRPVLLVGLSGFAISFLSATIHLAVFAGSWFLFSQPANQKDPAPQIDQTDPPDKI